MAQSHDEATDCWIDAEQFRELAEKSPRSQLQAFAARVHADQQAEDELWLDMRRGICSFCQQPVSIRDFVELATLRNGQMSYPLHDVDGGEPVVYLTHADCSPINGYWLSLDRLDPVDIEGDHRLVHHIESKVWGCWQYTLGIRLAAKLADKLRKSHGP